MESKGRGALDTRLRGHDDPLWGGAVLRLNLTPRAG
jgi:hypothetical protein